jgi:hypothetical protein
VVGITIMADRVAILNFEPPNSNSRGGYNKFRSSTTRPKKCYVRKKPNYWSIRLIPEERQQVYAKF